MQLEKAWPCCLPRDLLGTRQHHSGTHLGSSASSHRPDEIPAFPLFLPSPECLQGGAAALHCQGQEQSPLASVCSSQSRHGSSWSPTPSHTLPRPRDSRQGVLGGRSRALGPGRPGKANLILLHPFRECRICELSP